MSTVFVFEKPLVSSRPAASVFAAIREWLEAQDLGPPRTLLRCGTSKCVLRFHDDAAAALFRLWCPFEPKKCTTGDDAFINMMTAYHVHDLWG